MRAVGPLVLLNVALVLGFTAGRWPEMFAPVPPSGASAAGLDAPLAVLETPAEPPRPQQARRRPAQPPTPPEQPDAAAPRHEQLALRAGSGNAEAALDLSGMLESCAERDETRAIMNIIVADNGKPPDCRDERSCAVVERLYDEFDRSMQDWRDAERECATVPDDWLEQRGRWLRHAAELGDTEAMACYAVAGAELAPSSFQPEWAPWMEHWRAHAVSWAWHAWDRGEPRAALALARLYAPPVAPRADSAVAVEPNPRIAFRFALLLTRALDLDPLEDDLAALVELQAAQLSPSEFADEEAWARERLPALERRLALPSRTPEDCWQHFALFERDVNDRTAMR